MRTLKWLSLVAIVLALGVNLGSAQAAPVTRQHRAQEGTGRICVLAFEDTDGNGLRSEDSEPLLSGIGFTLSNETGRLATYTTDGNSEPYCFGNLAAGQYTVQAHQSTQKSEPTTPGQWVIPLANNAQYDVAYGLQSGASAAENATPADAAPSGSMSVLGRIVLGLLGLAMFGGAGFLAYQLMLRLRS